MFEHICITETIIAPSGNALIDIGFLAESLIFYEKVTVVVNRNTLRQLIEAFGPDLLIKVVQEGWLSIVYLENIHAVLTENSNTLKERHELTIGTISKASFHDYCPTVFQEIIGKEGKGRRVAHSFMKYCNTISIPESINESILQDFDNATYLEHAVVKLLGELAPTYNIPQNMVFKIHRDSKDLIIETNINFQMVNQSYNNYVSPKHSSFTSAYLLSLLSAPHIHLYYASTFSSEMATIESSSLLLEMKLSEMIKKRFQNDKEINTFENYLFNDARAIREAINSGRCNLIDIVQLLPEAKKFKKWVANKPYDMELIKAYTQEITKDSWVNELPFKSTRFIYFTLAGISIDATMGTGGIGTTTGITLTAFDTFLLDKILMGWKPSQFIAKLEQHI